jgi:hypothetical protein
MISHGNIIAMLKSMEIVATAEAAVAPVGSVSSHSELGFTSVSQPTKFSGRDELPINLAFLPLHHCYGLIGYGGRSLLSLVTLVIVPRWDLDFALELIPRYILIISQRVV